MARITENTIEQATLTWLKNLGYDSEVSDKLDRFVKKRRLQCPVKAG